MSGLAMAMAMAMTVAMAMAMTMALAMAMAIQCRYYSCYHSLDARSGQVPCRSFDPPLPP